MPVEGGFYPWTRAAFGYFWGFLSGWWNWTASFLLGGAYAVLFTDYLVYYFPRMTWWQHWLRWNFSWPPLAGHVDDAGRDGGQCRAAQQHGC